MFLVLRRGDVGVYVGVYVVVYVGFTWGLRGGYLGVTWGFKPVVETLREEMSVKISLSFVLVRFKTCCDL